MKNFRAILLLFLLFSCSDSNNKKIKLIEMCADYEYGKEWVVDNLEDFSIKDKLLFYEENYEKWLVMCEKALKETPETFKAKYK